jgi:hypothetical protein
MSWSRRSRRRPTRAGRGSSSCSPDFDGLEPGAWIEDVKTGFQAEIQKRSAWKKLALVSGVDWVTKATRLFAWAMPGELGVYEMDQLDQAKSWVAA